MIRLMDFEQIAATVADITGIRPASIGTVLDNIQTLAAARRPDPSSQNNRVVQAAFGKPLTEAAAAKLWRDVAAESVVTTETLSLMNALDHQAVAHLEKTLAGPDGDDLILSLRPAFEAALAGIQAAAAHYTTDTPLSWVVEAGPEAVEAWRTASEHQRVLDRIYEQVLTPLTLNAQILPTDAPSFTIQPMRLPAIWLVTADRPDIDGVGGALLWNGRASAPGGRWIEATRLAGLHLNTPTEALEVLQVLRDSRSAEAERVAAQQTVVARG